LKPSFRDLRPLLVGRTIRAVRASQQKLRRPWDTAWNERVVNRRIESVHRRGKWILVDLAGDAVLRVHLGMTGQFTVVARDVTKPDHLHLVFTLENQTELRFRDPRRFGAAEWFADRSALEAAMDDELGPEPFDLDAAYFRDAIRSMNRNLKAILLDQTIVAGVGNIYADEALFRSKLHPARLGKSLSSGECDRLRVAIEAVLRKAIKSRGSSIRDYVGGSGLRGGFQNEFAVYGRTGGPCVECEKPVECVRLGGRSSHFCPRCQRMKRKRREKSK
jgi:formamidopyrimidine-DNA glycosylase